MRTKLYVKLSEMIRKRMHTITNGQTMTEYALILAAVAIVAYVAYQTMGQDIGSMVNQINAALTA